MNPGAPKSISYEFQKEMTKNMEGKKNTKGKKKKISSNAHTMHTKHVL